MCCNNSKEVTQSKCGGNNGCSGHSNGISNFLIVVVLYILLAIIIGSCLF